MGGLYLPCLIGKFLLSAVCRYRSPVAQFCRVGYWLLIERRLERVEAVETGTLVWCLPFFLLACCI